MIELSKKQQEWNNYWIHYLNPAIIIENSLTKELKDKILPGKHGINAIVDFVLLAQDYIDVNTVRQLLTVEFIKDFKSGAIKYFSQNYFGIEDKNFNYWAIFKDGSFYLI